MQLELSELSAIGANVQLEAERLPVPVWLTLTEPEGFDVEPASVSFTVAVQWAVWLSATGLSQLTLVEVVRLLTVSAKPVASALLAWIESLAA